VSGAARLAATRKTTPGFARFALPAPDSQRPCGHDIFEGTEQIQQLVISRAISGLRIE
jgi:hypothetical protein